MEFSKEKTLITHSNTFARFLGYNVRVRCDQQIKPKEKFKTYSMTVSYTHLDVYKRQGRYELTYQVTDCFNNVAIVTRVVEVVENDDDQDINVQPGNDSSVNGNNSTTSSSANAPLTGDLANSNYLTLAVVSLMTFIIMIKKYLKNLKNIHK